MTPLIITAFTIGGAIAGYFLCALMKAGKVGDLQLRIDKTEYDNRCLHELWVDAEAEQTRCAAALTTKNERIERALECVTENSAHVGKKMARILRGDA